MMIETCSEPAAASNNRIGDPMATNNAFREITSTNFATKYGEVRQINCVAAKLFGPFGIRDCERQNLSV